MELLLSTFTKALGWAMIHSLWQGAAIYAIIGLIYLSFPKQSAKHKFYLAFAGQLIMLTVFLGTFLYYVNIPALLMQQQEIHTYLPIAPFIHENQENFQRIELLFPWFSAIYIIGLLIQLVIFSNSYTRLSYLKRNGLSEAPVEWVHAFEELGGLLKISKRVRFYLSDKISVPLTVGHFKPLILFPVALVNQLNMQQAEAILLHEIAHIKRNDYFINLISVLIETILFFNPFVWLLTKHIQKEREHACDDVVLQKLGSPITYAQALLSLETIKETTPLPYAMAATGQKQHLLQRIKRITKMEKNYIHVKQHLFALAISTLAFATIAWIAPDCPAEKAGQQEKETLAVESHPTKEALMLNLQDSAIYRKSTSSRTIDTLKGQRKTTVIYNNGTEASEAELEKYLNSPEWKEKFAKIKDDAKKVELYYNSPEWKEKIAKIELSARKAESHYNSQEWKDKVAKIVDGAKKVEIYYNSPEWKEKVAIIEKNASKTEAYYNSPEWKEKIASIEINAKDLVEKYMDSPAWKENAAQLEKLYASPELSDKISSLIETSVNQSLNIILDNDLLQLKSPKAPVAPTVPPAAGAPKSPTAPVAPKR